MNTGKQTMLGLVIVFGLSCFAVEPAGMPGLVKAKFTGSSFDSTSDVYKNALGYEIYPKEMYASSLDEKTTIAWAGYMKMTGGVAYYFKGCYDDYVTVKIAGKWVMPKGGECTEVSGSYKPISNGWYAVEFRVGNNTSGGGCRNSSEYGLLWCTSKDSTWRKLYEWTDIELFKTGVAGIAPLFSSTPLIVSSTIRESDPTVLDLEYVVYSAQPTVNIRALAFEDGERSFWKVVRPETFVDGTITNIGDNISANVSHKLSWKVSSDWDTDLAKVKFEILSSDQKKLPMDIVTVPSVNGVPDITFSYNSQTSEDVLNAMYWFYANGESDLVIDDGYLKTTNDIVLVSRDKIGDQYACTEYIAHKTGFEIFGGSMLHYAIGATRRQFATAWDSLCTNGMLNVSNEVYVGEKAYCVVDLSAGPLAKSYPVSYLNSYPVAGWGDEYKTSKIILRRIDPGLVTMGGKKPVTITNPFYIGVFEVTQKQYELITGTTPSTFKGDMRPVESITWDAIRGDSDVYNWPSITDVDPNTFIGKIRKRTGLHFDLPTESQWEYACRAGTSSDFNNGGDSEYDLKTLGRYQENCNDGKGGYSEHTVVGLYFPNAWGIYDMHGNACERCLDWYSSINSDPAEDWVGPSEGSYRVLRGGFWSYSYGYRCESSGRYDFSPKRTATDVGFRLAYVLTD